jgi:hypothetical protein
LVSFSQTALPVADVAQGLPRTAGYQAASFRVPVNRASNLPGAAHETLLKASMPVDRADRGVRSGQAIPKQRRAVSGAMLMRSSENRPHTPRMRRAQGWLVLTSWDGMERQRMVFAVTEERVISTSYAAVPTPGGWLVIQL